MYALALEVVTQRRGRSIGGRDAVVALQRKCRHQYLSLIRGVGKAFGIAGHSGIEHHFAGSPGSVIAKRMAAKNGAVFEYQSGGRCLSHNACRRNIGAVIGNCVAAGGDGSAPDALSVCKFSVFFRNNSHGARPVCPFSCKKILARTFCRTQAYIFGQKCVSL